MKQCTKCLLCKEPAEFHKDKSRKDGLRNCCKVCVSAYMRTVYAADSDSVKKKVYAWIAANRDRHNAKCARWVKANPGKVNERTARRYAAKTQATPTWLSSDDRWILSEAYDLAKLRERVVGGKWEVDHIVPLRGRGVRGLHVPWNVQVVPMLENRRKSNTLAVV